MPHRVVRGGAPQRVVELAEDVARRRGSRPTRDRSRARRDGRCVRARREGGCVMFMSMPARAVSGTANGNERRPRRVKHAAPLCYTVAALQEGRAGRAGAAGDDRVGGGRRARVVDRSLASAQNARPAASQAAPRERRRRASSSASTGWSSASRCRRASTPCCCRSARSSPTASPPTAPTSSRRSPSRARSRRG